MVVAVFMGFVVFVAAVAVFGPLKAAAARGAAAADGTAEATDGAAEATGAATGAAGT